MPVPTILLTTKGDLRKANLPLTEHGTLTLESLQHYMKKKDAPEVIHQYEQRKQVWTLLGYKKGKKGTENKTELLACSTVLFGDALIILSVTKDWSHPLPCIVEQWMTFCQESQENQENQEEEEEEDEDEEESIKDPFEESDDEKDPHIDKVEEEDEEEEEEEAEEAPVAVKRRAPIYTKVDTHALKEEIPITSEPSSSPLRLRCLSHLQFLTAFFPEEDIHSLEKAIFEASHHYAQEHYIARNWKSDSFSEVYRQRMMSILSNLHPESPVQNTRLLRRVQEGEFTLASLATMTAYEMFPEKWFVLKDKLLQREQKILEGNKSRATDQFKCRRCQKRECTYYELQTRSADEPMTIFITCLNCGKEWRQGG